MAILIAVKLATEERIVLTSGVLANKGLKGFEVVAIFLILRNHIHGNSLTRSIRQKALKNICRIYAAQLFKQLQSLIRDTFTQGIYRFIF